MREPEKREGHSKVNFEHASSKVVLFPAQGYFSLGSSERQKCHISDLVPRECHPGVRGSCLALKRGGTRVQVLTQRCAFSSASLIRETGLSV